MMQYLKYSLLLAMAFMAFQLPQKEAKPIPSIIQKKLDDDIKEYIAERRRVCEVEALTRAEEYVDSIIINKISLSVLQGIRFPDKPIRPKSPNEIKLDDTTKILPIFKKK